MYWSKFVDGCDIWPLNVIIRNIDFIENFPSGSEVAESLCMLQDEIVCDKLVNKALHSGVEFCLADVIEMDGHISDGLRDWFLSVIIQKQKIYTRDELDYFMDFLDKNMFSSLVLRQIQSGGHFVPDHVLDMITCEYVDEYTTDRLVHYLVDNGYDFKYDEIIDLAEYISQSLFDDLIIARAKKDGGISYDDLLDAAEYLSERTVFKLLFKSIECGKQYSPEQISDFECYVSTETLVAMMQEVVPNINSYDLERIKQVISLSTLYDMMYRRK